MNKLVFAALMLGGLSQATGCIITSDDDDPAAQLSVNWQLTSTGGDPCPPNGSVEVVSQRSGGAEFIDIYDCVAGEGVTAPLPLGTYTVWVNVITEDDLLWAQSFATDVTLDLEGEVVPLNFDILTDEGYLFATWTLTEEVTNDPLTCAEVGANGVSILSTLVDSGGMGYDDIFACEDGEGTTSPLPIGDYTVVTTLLDDNDASLGSSEARDVAITYGNELVDLGNFEFEFPPAAQ